MTPLANKYWIPSFNGNATVIPFVNDVPLDVDEKEYQIIGRVYLEAGSGSKTFSNASPSAISWIAGAGNIWVADAGALHPVLTVGLKKASSISMTLGPPARATVGSAAFDVWRTLTGGTDAMPASTARTDVMTNGTGFTVTHNDLICMSWHLRKPGATAQNVRVRGSNDQFVFPSPTLFTSPSTYTAQASGTSAIIVFADGTRGWVEGGQMIANLSLAETIGNTNHYGNIIRLPFDCEVDALRLGTLSSATADTQFGIYKDIANLPNVGSWTLLTPVDANSVVTIDHQVVKVAAISSGVYVTPLAAPVRLLGNRDYFLCARQNSATAVSVGWWDVDHVSHWAASGSSDIVAYKATAGATPILQNAGKRRAAMWMRVSAMALASPQPTLAIGL